MGFFPEDQPRPLVTGETFENMELDVGNCMTLLGRIPDEGVALVVTSPPYDKLRSYDDYQVVDLQALGHEVYRVLRPGGIAVMVMQDQTEDFAKSLTSIRTTMHWCDEVGFKLFEMLIFSRHGAPGGHWNSRFRVDHEYMPVFLKGDKPAFFDKSHMDGPAKTARHWMKRGVGRRSATVR